MNEIIESLYKRKSMRVYEERTIPEAMKRIILEAAAQAPAEEVVYSTSQNEEAADETPAEQE